jgi:hypothetical protein
VSWDADVATIVARGSSIGEQIFTAQIVEHSETSVVLRDIEGALADASLNLRDGGRGVLDAETPQLGTVHFVLQAQ